MNNFALKILLQSRTSGCLKNRCCEHQCFITCTNCNSHTIARLFYTTLPVLIATVRQYRDGHVSSISAPLLETRKVSPCYSSNYESTTATA